MTGTFTSDIVLFPHNQITFGGPPYTPHKIVIHEGDTNREDGEFHVSPSKPAIHGEPRGLYYLVVRYYRDELPKIVRH